MKIHKAAVWQLFVANRDRVLDAEEVFAIGCELDELSAVPVAETRVRWIRRPNVAVTDPGLPFLSCPVFGFAAVTSRRFADVTGEASAILPCAVAFCGVPSDPDPARCRMSKRTLWLLLPSE